MEREDVIITISYLVCKCFRAINNTYLLRRGGFAPALTDAVQGNVGG